MELSEQDKQRIADKAISDSIYLFAGSRISAQELHRQILFTLNQQLSSQSKEIAEKDRRISELEDALRKSNLQLDAYCTEYLKLKDKV